MVECVKYSKSEFIKAFENGTLQQKMLSFFDAQKIDPPKKGEQRSWNNSYAFLDIVLRDEEIPSDITVFCEYPLTSGTDHPKRIDILIEGVQQDAQQPKVLALIELKQWDRFYLKDVRDKSQSPEDPVKQALGYKEDLLKSCGQDVNISTYVYLHNLSAEDAEPYEKEWVDSEDLKVIHQGEIDKFQEELATLFSNNAALPTKAIKRGRESGYWDATLPSKAGELRTLLLDKGLASLVKPNEYDYEPTKEGRKHGIKRYKGFNQREMKEFISCAFTDECMRELAAFLVEK